MLPTDSYYILKKKQIPIVLCHVLYVDINVQDTEVILMTLKSLVSKIKTQLNINIK